MVKGTNRRVIVVKSPDPRVFEEAIFVLREDYAKGCGDAGEVFRQAKKAAGEYLKSCSSGKRTSDKLRGTLFAIAGAAIAGLAWVAVYFAGI